MESFINFISHFLIEKQSFRKIGVILFFIVFILYGNTLLNDYNLDDELVTRNHKLTSQGISALPEIFTSPYYQDEVGYSYEYRPIVLASFAIEHQFLGEHAFISHLINVLLYFITSFILYYFLILISNRNTQFALFSSIIFVLLPVHTEVVASIKNRDEILCLLFAIVFLLINTIGISKKNIFIILISYLFLVISILSKTSSFSFVFYPFLLYFFLNSQPRILLSIFICSTIYFVFFFEIKPTELNIQLLIYALLLLIFFFSIIKDYKDYLVKVILQIKKQLFYQASFFSFTLPDDINYLKEVTINRSFLLIGALSAAFIFIAFYIKNYYLVNISFALLFFYFLFEKKKNYSFILLIFGFLFILHLLIFFNFNSIPKTNDTLLNDTFTTIFLLFCSSHFYRNFLTKKFFLTSILLLLIIFIIISMILFNNEVVSVLILLLAILLFLLFSFQKKKYFYLLWLILGILFFIISEHEMSIEHVLELFVGVYIFISNAILFKEDTNNRVKYTNEIILCVLFFISLNIGLNRIINHSLFISNNNSKSTSIVFNNDYKIESVTRNNFLAPNMEDRPLTFVEFPLGFNPTFSQKYGTVAGILGKYLKMMFLPYPMAFYYGYNEIQIIEITNPVSIISIILHLLLLFVAMYFARKHTILSFGIFSYLSSIVLFSNLAAPIAGMFGDRLTYVASFGFSIAMGYLFFWGYTSFSNTGKKILVASFVALFVSYSGLTIARNAQWKNHLTLMRHDIRYLDNSAQAHNLLASSLMKYSFDESYSENILKDEMRKEAAFHFKRATEIYPSFFNAWYDLGRTYLIINNVDSAYICFKEVHNLDSTFSDATLNIAVIAEQKQDYDTAIYYYERLIKFNPYVQEAYANLSYLYFRLQQPKKSIEVNQRALAYNPNWQEPRENIKRMEEFLQQNNLPLE